MIGLGIDIGTTSISCVMVDEEKRKTLGTRTVEHKAFVKALMASGRTQDAGRIFGIVKQVVLEMIEAFGKPDAIGFTGQMHGMLYVDSEGRAVSPLYTWQDGCGNELMADGLTCAQVLKEATGSAASGYGIVTHFYLQRKKMIRSDAVKMVTISDYVAMKLCGRKEAFIAEDMAASWGCFDLEIGDFCWDEMEEVGVDTTYLPELIVGHGMIGRTVGNGLPEGIPVMASYGDNQASVLGSVEDLSNTVLVNIGTGSQVSFGTSRYVEAQGAIELRPYTDYLYLMAGSGLCGGRAYAMLEQFYREAAGRAKEESFYDLMESQTREFMETYGMEAAWKVRTTFSGTRNNPKERGSITGIGVENFHPGAMTLGMLIGIVDELYEMYGEMCRMTGSRAVHLVGSGNAVRHNSLLREIAEERFHMSMEIPKCCEEAAYGAAMQACREYK